MIFGVSTIMGSIIKKLVLNSGLIFILSIGGCASVPEELEMLDNTLKNYEKAMLWSEYDYILTSHKGQNLNEYQHEKLKGIKVTSYDVLRSKLLPGGKKFVQIIALKYYNRSYGVVRSIRVEQEWVFEEERGAWVVLTPFPDFK